MLLAPIIVGLLSNKGEKNDENQMKALAVFAKRHSWYRLARSLSED